MDSVSHDDSLDSIKYTKTVTIPITQEAFKENRIVMGVQDDPRSDLFRILRTNILKQLRENGWNNLLITSATQGAGKTMVSINLAIAIALEGNQSVILVDADLRRPSICQHLGIECEYGFVDYLTGKVSIEKVLINPGIHNLVILPGKYTKCNFSELISSPTMGSFVKDLKSRYKSRIVIFDIPPLFVSDDALLFMSYFDAALFVIEDEKNKTDEIKHAMVILEETNLLGIVLNKSKQKLPPHKYGYGYGYGYGQDTKQR